MPNTTLEKLETVGREVRRRLYDPERILEVEDLDNYTRFTDYALGVMSTAIDKRGKQFQLTVAIEEMAELTKELTKVIRSGSYETNDNLEEEIADVLIMLQQVCIILSTSDSNIWSVISAKINRLTERMDLDPWSEIEIK